MAENKKCRRFKSSAFFVYFNYFFFLDSFFSVAFSHWHPGSVPAIMSAHAAIIISFNILVIAMGFLEIEAMWIVTTKTESIIAIPIHAAQVALLNIKLMPARAKQTQVRYTQ
jgi:hypothetical protein